MSDPRDRLMSLISENSAFDVGRAYERSWIRRLIIARIEELGGTPQNRRLEKELRQLIKRLDDQTERT